MRRRLLQSGWEIEQKAEQVIDLLQLDLLASEASLFWPRSGRPQANEGLFKQLTAIVTVANVTTEAQRFSQDFFGIHFLSQKPLFPCCYIFPGLISAKFRDSRVLMMMIMRYDVISGKGHIV